MKIKYIYSKYQRYVMLCIYQSSIHQDSTTGIKE